MAVVEAVEVAVAPLLLLAAVVGGCLSQSVFKNSRVAVNFRLLFIGATKIIRILRVRHEFQSNHYPTRLLRGALCLRNTS